MNKFVILIVISFFMTSCGGNAALDQASPSVSVHEKNQKSFHNRMLNTKNSIIRGSEQKAMREGNWRPSFNPSFPDHR